MDKLLFLRFYQKPTSFDVDMQAQAMGAIRYAPVLYLMVAIWIYGSNESFYDTSHSTKGTVPDLFGGGFDT